MPNIYTAAQRFRAALLARDTAAAGQLIAAYGLAYRRLQIELDSLLARIDAARLRGDRISEAWLIRENRFRILMQQVAGELDALAGIATDRITARQQIEIERALRDAGALLETGLQDAPAAVSFNQISPAALENLVGTFQDGSPLAQVLRKHAGEAVPLVQKALIEGIVLGENPRKVAGRMRDAFGGNLTNALRVARTESLRAYREASRETYKANADIVSGWVWIASKSVRTCLNCLARDGEFYPLSKPLPSHVNCRCTIAPRLKLLPPPPYETGAEWFAQQPDDIKQQMMSKAAFEAYKNGEITIQDFRGERTTKEWGVSTFERSLKQIQSGAYAAKPQKRA